MIPPKSNRKIQRAYDKELHKARHLMEDFYYKQYRASDPMTHIDIHHDPLSSHDRFLSANHAKASCNRDRLGSAAGIEFGIDVAQMGAHGAIGNE